MDALLYLLILGAILSIVISWIYDVTPKGVEKTKPLSDIQAGEKPVVSYRWKITTYVSLIVIVGLIIFNLSGGFKQLTAGSIQSLVVLPFDNFTGDEDLEYFVSGMHSSLIGDMGKIHGLRVISTKSSNKYRNQDISVPEIASELLVDAVVEANVTCLDDRVCIQLKLISAFPEEQMLWSRTYDTEMRDILNLYNGIIRDISNEIQLPISSEQLEQLDQPRPIDPEAYELYLKGKFHMGFLTKESQQTALDYFTKATEIDQEYAAAYAGIAGVWGVFKADGLRLTR